ncbi:amino acid adenylation domain-containing protein [Streptomyces uncialis]|uniref:non-ribosomal peptide synthetase n=1 Tax=Streptomyces uncialis TaxID=1048205 RepID=UPI00365D4672
MSESFTSPVSSVQEQIWFLEQLAPDQRAYNLPLGIRLRGQLDVEALQAALTELVRRHESLRTTFGTVEGRPIQMVAAAPGRPLHLPVEPCPVAETADSAVRDLLGTEAHTGFDIGVSTFRHRLFRLSDDDHLLSLCMHHLISDAGSYSVIIRDLGQLYREAAKGVKAELPTLPIQYVDYTQWQRQQAFSPETERKLRYWEGRLEGAPPLDVRTDRQRPPVQSFRGETLVHELDPQLITALLDLSRSNRCTLFMTLFAALNVLLSRYTGQQDVVIGSAESGRGLPELDGLVGLFTNSVVLRTDLSGDPSFTEMQRRTRDTLLDAADHADVPFEKLVDRLPNGRANDRNPLFQIAMSQLPTYPGFPSDAGIDGSVELVGPGGSRFDFNINVYYDAGRLQLFLEYSTDLFDRSTMLRLLDHYERLLTAVADDPTVQVPEIELLSSHERETVLAAWQGRTTEYPRVPVHQLISAQARRTPEAPAATCGDQTLTYGDLDLRSDILARYLRRKGLLHEDIVGVAFERHVDALVAYLAVSKAGGAYLPLDPGHPAKRLEYVVDDASASIVLTHSSVRDRLPQLAGSTVIPIDTSWNEIDEARGDVLPEWTDEQSAVQVLYTSGSTGRPKGVVIEHGALSNFTVWMARDCRIAQGDRMLQYFSLVFDVAHGEIFTALTHGATVVLVPPEVTLSPPALAEVIRRERCTYVGAPPAMLSLIEPGPYPELRCVLVAGESFPGALVNRWNQPGRQFVNLYGPAEATVGCTSYVCEQDDWRSSPPIGRPMDNRRVYLVDSKQNPVPVGVPGEILVGGVGVAREYLNNPELTEERFVEDPFRPGDRAYRSGDLGVWTESGQIQFLGRMDGQVKLRSQRVELGEVEAVLSTHPEVRQTVVVIRGEQMSDRRLVAYVIPRQDAAPTPQSLRDHLAGELPTYMVPSAYVVLERLPLGPTGKLNRALLPEPPAQVASAVHVPPRTPAEEVVAEAFSSVLGHRRVGAEDDFFALGGTSLQVAAVVSFVKERTGATLALRDMYSTPTVEAVAGVLRSSLGARSQVRPRMVVLREHGTADPLFCLPHVFGTSLAYRGLLPHLPTDQPLFAVEPPDFADGSGPQPSLSELATAYLGAVRAWKPQGPYALLGHSMGGTTAFEMAFQLEQLGSASAPLIMVEPSIEFGESTSRANVGRRFVELLAKVAGRPAPPFDDALDSASAPDFVRGMLALLKTHQLAEPGLDVPKLEVMFRSFSTNITAFWKYRPTGRLQGRIILIRSEDDSSADPAEWEEHCSHVEDIVVPGSHFSLWNDPYVTAVAARVRRELETSRWHTSLDR